jgi:hypothetical protein
VGLEKWREVERSTNGWWWWLGVDFGQKKIGISSPLFLAF